MSENGRPDPSRPSPGRFHAGAGDTELGAATGNPPRIGTQRAFALETYRARGDDGVTDYEMNELLVPGRRSVSAGTRRAELIRDGWPIVDSGRRRPTDTGTPAVVWVLLDGKGQGMAEPTLVRRNHGGGHTYRLDGQHAPGVTTALNAGFPKPAIARWAARAASEEVLDFWDELVELSPSDRAERVRTAPDRDRDAAARRGTEVHTLAERLATTGEADVPEELAGHVDAYLRFVDEWQPRELLVEAVIAKRKPRYCGTLDLVTDLADGNRWLLDLKTTRSGVFAENALQLAAYRFADFYVDGDGAEQPIPEVDRAGVVWLRADRTYELVPVEAGSREFVLFRMVLEVARFADEKFARDEYVPVVGAALTPPVKEVAA